MPTFDAGSVSATLELDRAPFTASLNIARSMAAQFEANDVTATLKANLRPLMGALRSARASLQSFSRERAEATLGVDSAGANAAIESVTQNLQQYGRERETATVDANTRPARRALDGFDEVMRRYGRSWGQQGIRARVQADIRRAQTQLRVLERTVEGLEGDYKIRVDADILRTRQRLEGLGRLATSLGLRSPTIRVGLRGHLATAAQMVGLQGLADRLDGYKIRFGASIDDSLSRALPNLLGALELQVARWKVIMTSVAAVTMPIFYSALAGVPAAISVAAGAVGSLIIAIGEGIAGAVGIAGTALTQGLVGALSVAGGALGLGGVALGGYYAAVNRTVSYLGDLTSTLTSAREDVKSASKAVEQARIRMNKAEEGTKEYANATRGLALAQEESRYRQRRLNALYDIATPRVQRLQTKVNDARIGLLRFGGAIMDRVAPAIITGLDTFGRFSRGVSRGALDMVEDMSRVAQSFIRALSRGRNLRSITTILQGIKSAGVPALQLVGNAAILTVNLLAPLVGHSLRFLNNLKDLVAEAARWSQTEEGQRRIKETWRLLARQGERLVTVATNVGGILFDIFAPATPYAEDFLDALVGITDRIKDWTGSARGQRRIAQAWKTLAERGEWLYEVVKNIASGMAGVVVALDKSGTVDFMANAVLRLSRRFRRLMRDGGEGRKAIEEFMRSAQPLLTALGELGKEAAKQFLRLADEVINFKAKGEELTVLEDIAYSIRDSLEEVTDFLLYEFKNIGPLIGPLIEELTDWFSTMAKSQPEMKAFIRLLTKTLEFFNGLPEDTQRNIARIIAYIAAFKALGGGAAASGLATLTASVVQWRLLRNIWKRMPPQPVVTPPISPAGPMPVGRRAGPRIPPPVVPAPVPQRGFVRNFLTRLRGMGWVAALGGFFAGIWRKIPFSAQLGRAFSGLRIGPALTGLVGFGARLIAGLVRFLMGPAGWLLLAISLYDSVIKDFDIWLTKALGEAFNIDLEGILNSGPTKWGEDFGKWCRKQLGEAWQSIKEWWNSPDRWSSLGKAIGRGIVRGLLEFPVIGPLIKSFIDAWDRVREWWGVKSPSTRAAKLGKDIARGLINGVTEWLRGRWDAFTKWGSNTLRNFNQWRRGKQRAFSEWAQGIWQSFNNWRRGRTQALREWAAGILRSFNNWRRGKQRAFTQWAQGIWTSFNQWRRGKVRALREWASNILQNFTQWRRGKQRAFTQWAQGIWQNFNQYRRGKVRAIREWASNLLQNFTQWRRGKQRAFTDWARSIWNNFNNWRRGKTRAIREWATNLLNNFTQWRRSKQKAFSDWAQRILNNFNNWRRNKIDGISSWASRMLERFNTWRRNKTKALGSWARGLWQGFLETIRRFGNPLVEWAQRIIKGVNDWRARYSPFKILGNNMIVGLINGWNAVDVARHFVDKIQGGFQALMRWLRSRSPSRRFADMGHNIADGLTVGMDERQGSVERAAVNMGRSATNALTREMKIQSPSKKFRNLGAQLGAGLAAGILQSTNKAVAATRELAEKINREVEKRLRQQGINVDLTGSEPSAGTPLRPAPNKPRPTPKSPVPTRPTPKPPVQPPGGGPPPVVVNPNVPITLYVQDMEQAEEMAVEKAKEQSEIAVRKAFREQAQKAASSGSYIAGQV